MKTPDELLRQFEEPVDAVADRLPDTTQITVDTVNSRGRRYQGVFTFKIPNVGEQIQIGRLKSTYLPQGGAADVNAAILVDQVCYLTVTLQGVKPEWWKPFEMYDAEVISIIYGEALTYERKFHGADADSADAGEGTRPAQHDADAGSDTPSEASVGRKVRPPAERQETIISHSARGG